MSRYRVVETWAVFDSYGECENTYESLEALELFEGKEANIDQGYIIIDDLTGSIPEWSQDYYPMCKDAKMDIVCEMGGVHIDDECIAIYNVQDEIVYWSNAEWEEDPSIIVSITNAIRIFYEEGPQALKEVISHAR